MAEGRHRRADCDENHAEEETCLPPLRWYTEPQNIFKQPAWLGMYETGFGLTGPGFLRLEKPLQDAARRIILTEATLKTNTLTPQHAQAFLEEFPSFKRAPEAWGNRAAIMLMLKYAGPEFGRLSEEARKHEQRTSQGIRTETNAGIKSIVRGRIPGLPSSAITIKVQGFRKYYIATSCSSGISPQNHDHCHSDASEQNTPFKTGPRLQSSNRSKDMTSTSCLSISKLGTAPVDHCPSEHSTLVDTQGNRNITHCSQDTQEIVKTEQSQDVVPDLVADFQDPRVEEDAMETKKHFILFRRHRQTYMSIESVSRDGKLSWDLLTNELRTVFGHDFHEVALLDERESACQRFSHFAVSQATVSTVMDMEPFKSAVSVYLSPVDMMGKLLDDTGDIEV